MQKDRGNARLPRPPAGGRETRRLGDENPLALVYEQAVRAAAQRLKIHFDDAREALHEVVLRVLEAQAGRARKKRLKKPKDYLTKSAVGAYRRSQGENHRLVLLSELSPDQRTKLLEETPGRGADPARAAADRELAWVARLELGALPERQRRVVALRCSDMAYREIARLLNITPGNARVHYHAGIQELRRRFGVAA